MAIVYQSLTSGIMHSEHVPLSSSGSMYRINMQAWLPKSLIIYIYACLSDNLAYIGRSITGFRYVEWLSLLDLCVMQ